MNKTLQQMKELYGKHVVIPFSAVSELMNDLVNIIYFDYRHSDEKLLDDFYLDAKCLLLGLLHKAYLLDNSIGNVEELAESYLSRLPSIREKMDLDLMAIYDGDPAAKYLEEIVTCYPGFYAILIYRLAHELVLLKIPVIPRIMSEKVHSMTGIDINPGATIGNSFCIDHGTGIVIGETTIIGNNVKLYQGVTLGALSTRAGQGLKGIKRHPTIEDNVTIYAGASILGDTTIAKNTTIGSNVFITEDVKEGSKISYQR